jgi:hypothetical protein
MESRTSEAFAGTQESRSARCGTLDNSETASAAGPRLVETRCQDVGSGEHEKATQDMLPGMKKAGQERRWARIPRGEDRTGMIWGAEPARKGQDRNELGRGARAKGTGMNGLGGQGARGKKPARKNGPEDRGRGGRAKERTERKRSAGARQKPKGPCRARQAGGKSAARQKKTAPAAKCDGTAIRFFGFSQVRLAVLQTRRREAASVMTDVGGARAGLLTSGS